MTGTRKITVLILTGVLVALGALYALIDPAQSVWMPKCLFHFATGLDCPGCGSQRAVHALLRGDFAGAFHYNAFLVIFIPFMLLIAVSEFWPRKFSRLHRVITSSAVIYAFLGVTIVWAVIRNIFLSR